MAVVGRSLRRQEVARTTDVAGGALQWGAVHRFAAADVGQVKAAARHGDRLYFSSRKGVCRFDLGSGRCGSRALRRPRAPVNAAGRARSTLCMMRLLELLFSNSHTPPPAPPSAPNFRCDELPVLGASHPLVHAVAVARAPPAWRGSSGGGAAGEEAAVLWVCTGSGSGSICSLEDGSPLRKVILAGGNWFWTLTSMAPSTPTPHQE
jgi:hypothetical protein